MKKIPEPILKRVAALMSVKSVVTLVLTGVFAYLAVTGQIAQDFMTVYAVVIAFYFGTQSQKVQDVLTDGTEDSPTTITNYYQLPTEEGENGDSK
jgi:hypothetical protein|nr:MAG TPA: hypothetical protein [Caudoviricetes sp.]